MFASCVILRSAGSLVRMNFSTRIWVNHHLDTLDIARANWTPFPRAMSAHNPYVHSKKSGTAVETKSRAVSPIIIIAKSNPPAFVVSCRLGFTHVLKFQVYLMHFSVVGERGADRRRSA